MRRRNPAPQSSSAGTPPLPGSRSKSSSSSSSFALSGMASSLGRFNARANCLVLSLFVGIILWVVLCFHIHLRLTIERRAPLGGRLRKRFMRRDGAQIIDAQAGARAGADGGNNNKSGNHATTTSSEEGISACLLVNDENPRLPEWIAYHYHVLPLRSLTVAVDPASRSSPREIFDRWRDVAGLDVQVWEERRYMPYGGDGACHMGDPGKDCLKIHRKRQQHFVRACMKDFKDRSKSWVLLTDVDEYITFNTWHDTDPPAPLDAPPEGVPMLGNWTWKRRGFFQQDGTRKDDTMVEGTISNLPPEGWHGIRNGHHKSTLPLVNPDDEIFYGAYGSVFTDEAGNGWFLRDDHSFRDAVDMTPEEAEAGKLPIITNSRMEGNTLHGTMVTRLNNQTGVDVRIQTNWREPPPSAVLTAYKGGHTMRDLFGKQFYVVRDTLLWPPHLSTRELVDMRKRLPTVADGVTVLDVLNGEMARLEPEYANETIGPCLGMPRVYYGSLEDHDDPTWESMAPDGFEDKDFMTLRYRWHSLPDNRVNKYQKTIIDVRRIPRKGLKGEAENIHYPVKYYCRERQPPRYSVSPFRVNHYLDSFEAYTYRNDARAGKQSEELSKADARRGGCRTKQCYNDKGREAKKQKDDDIRPWLKAFVESVGQEKAKALLAGAGNFVHLS